MTGVLGLICRKTRAACCGGCFRERRSLIRMHGTDIQGFGYFAFIGRIRSARGLDSGFYNFSRKKVGLKVAGLSFFCIASFAYVYICGCKPATLRAFIMILMAMGAVRLDDTMTSTALAASALVILVFNPLLLFTVGFQLSYLRRCR